VAVVISNADSSEKAARNTWRALAREAGPAARIIRVVDANATPHLPSPSRATTAVALRRPGHEGDGSS
jgi:hypothetical protein